MAFEDVLFEQEMDDGVLGEFRVREKGVPSTEEHKLIFTNGKALRPLDTAKLHTITWIIFGKKDAEFSLSHTIIEGGTPVKRETISKRKIPDVDGIRRDVSHAAAGNIRYTRGIVRNLKTGKKLS